MQTITNKNSLVYFEQNRNRSNIFINGGKDTKLCLKENYFNVFNDIAEKFKDTSVKYNSFVKIWHNVCNAECKKVEDNIKNLIHEKYKKEDIEAVVRKFRGNLGEIFTEKFFISGLASDICDGSTYSSVDPNNERFVDANVTSNITNLPIGVQVKNYNIEAVRKETFDKAAAEDRLRISDNKIIPDENLILYRNSPHQVILSFTNAHDIFIETYKNIVIFLGPKYIDSKKLHGDYRKNLPAKWMFFKQIADEINNLS